jgi:epoxyqueuosine reductase
MHLSLQNADRMQALLTEGGLARESLDMDFNAALENLAAKGLNIFASVPMHELPAELRTFAQEPEYDHYSLCMLGHGGTALWKSLPHPLEASTHPIDLLTIAQIDWFTRTLFPDADVILAFPRPDWILPLQRLGRFLNLARPSLLGLDLNEEYGPWFAYRGVFLTSAKVPRFLGTPFDSACETCAEKPCQKVCPAGAVGQAPQEFHLGACASFRLSENSRCADRCLARMACPVGAEHRYSLEQMQYHMGRSAHLNKLKAYRP